MFHKLCLDFPYVKLTLLPSNVNDKCKTFYKIARRVKLDRDFSNRDTLHSVLSQFRNLAEIEVHVNLTKAKKTILIRESNVLQIKKLLVTNRDLFDWNKLKERRDTTKICPLMKKDLDAIKIDIDDNSEHTATITEFNEFVKTSVAKYESGDALDSDLNALALHNIILIQPGDNNYGIESNDWDCFKDFVQGDSEPIPTQLNAVEKDVILSSISGKASYRQLAAMEEKLLECNSSKIDQILRIVQNVERIGTGASFMEEDLLITDFVEPLLMEPFLRTIPGTTIHGNGHPLHESYIRKIKIAKKHGLPLKGMRGRAPDRTIEFQISENKKFSVLVAEIKIKKNAHKKPDFVKLATLMKDILDFAMTRGIDNYLTTGMLVAGSSCKIYKLHMPIKKMYCMTEVTSFDLPDNINDIHFYEKIQKIVIAMSQCRSMIDNSILLLQSPSPSPCENNIVDSYPSPANHNTYYK